MGSSPVIQILMSVLNGERYLDSALESVRSQDYSAWQILVRDDGSTDRTGEILADWRSRLGERLHIVPNEGNKNLGMNVSYSSLLQASSAPYITLLSHDDRYHPNKLSLTLDAMRHHEAKVGASRPILVYTDLAVIDERSETVARSHWKHVGWRPPRARPLGQLLVHSAVCGGACLINRPLIALLGDPPLCEDVWFALVAAVLGDLVLINQPTVDFRWHTANESKQVAIGSLLRRVATNPLLASPILHSQLASLRPRAGRLLNQLQGRLAPDDAATLQAFLDLPNMGPLARRRAILRHGLLYPSWPRTLGLLLLV